jgi:hypothetical protein
MHCYGAKLTCLTKDMVFFNECTAVNVPKFEGVMLHWLFVLKEQTMDNSFNIRKADDYVSHL